MTATKPSPARHKITEPETAPPPQAKDSRDQPNLDSNQPNQPNQRARARNQGFATPAQPPPRPGEDATLAAVTTVWHQLREVLLEYHNSFATSSEGAGRTHMIQHHIETAEAAPIKLQPYYFKMLFV
ncbi:hypothetical protein EOD39_14793 [Acipenser ruthenus]|uniref:Uncharacterized protein n=1 Tax=Acipenser ruthenus TaxID=7906 RepID=A0A662YK80_ACIRT|nr:hypothetical protein EOD39_14793 [Acipenser ruthenus]